MTLSDLEYIRQQFPALAGGYLFFDNAGGSQTVRHCVEKLGDYLINTNVQLGASYGVSVAAGERVQAATQQLASFINAPAPEEVIPGSSTTQLLQNLARSLSLLLKPGDEVVVTNCDHEANIGPWRSLERFGIVIREWPLNRDDLQLHLSDLEPLMNSKTRLVAFTHVSNVLGTIHPVKEIASFVHERGALTCVDGVAFAPHRSVDVQEMGVDFYVLSFYKVFGPHYSLLYGRNDILKRLPGINHYFIAEDEIPYKLQPGNVNFELTWSLTGVLDYLNDIYCVHFGDDHSSTRVRFEKVYTMFAEHEQELAGRLIDFLTGKPNVKIIGAEQKGSSFRVPTVSFVHKRLNSSDIPVKVDSHGIGIRFGDFYARRLIEYLGLSTKSGVVRVSMAHYNTMEEVDRLCQVLDGIL